jgi:hypothetical protein
MIRNRFFIGQEVYHPDFYHTMPITAIRKSGVDNNVAYEINTDGNDIWYRESDLYDSKEAYEAEKNQIRVGDEFYYMNTPHSVSKLRATLIRERDENSIEVNGIRHSRLSSFKTKELLLEAVKKAVEDCE